jgi:hypothetical protein
MTEIIKKTGNRITVSPVGILISLFILFIIFTGCIAREKISKDEAIRIALSDARTIQAINNSDFNVSEVSTANLSVGTESQKEVYYISIKVSGVNNKRVNVFVTYNGKVALVDIPYPIITPPDYLLNNSHSVISGWNATVRNSTGFIPEHVPLETPV